MANQVTPDDHFNLKRRAPKAYAGIGAGDIPKPVWTDITGFMQHKRSDLV
jgi:hypothetical protein